MSTEAKKLTLPKNIENFTNHFDLVLSLPSYKGRSFFIEEAF